MKLATKITLTTSLASIMILAAIFPTHNAYAVVVIDFETLVDSGGNGDWTGNEFIGDGIVFTTPDLALNLNGGVSGVVGAGADLVVENDFDGSLLMEFTGNQCASDLTFTLGNPPVSAEAFDINGISLGTDSDNGNFFDELSFVGLPVHSVLISGEFYIVDDFTFTLEACPDALIGGEFLPIDSTLLLLAGLQTSAIWMLPALVGIAGAGAYLVRARINKE